MILNGEEKPPTYINDAGAIGELIRELQPHQIYHLAAHNHSSEQSDQDRIGSLRKNFQVHVDAFLGLLEGVACHAPLCRIFYAASSHVFGNTIDTPQTEKTLFNPIDPYGMSKSAGIEIGRFFRKNHGIFVSSGILYNHESPRRPDSFLIPSIINQGLAIKNGRANSITVGNLSTQVDWGHAPEYIKAMRCILGAEYADDYIIASGRLHSVHDAVKSVVKILELPESTMINEDKSRLASTRHNVQLVGDTQKLSACTGWKPIMELNDIIGEMIDAKLDGG